MTTYPQEIDRLVLIRLFPSRLTIFKSVIHTDTRSIIVSYTQIFPAENPSLVSYH